MVPGVGHFRDAVTGGQDPVLVQDGAAAAVEDGKVLDPLHGHLVRKLAWEGGGRNKGEGNETWGRVTTLSAVSHLSERLLRRRSSHLYDPLYGEGVWLLKNKQRRRKYRRTKGGGDKESSNMDVDDGWENGKKLPTEEIKGTL